MQNIIVSQSLKYRAVPKGKSIQNNFTFFKKQLSCPLVRDPVCLVRACLQFIELYSFHSLFHDTLKA